MAQAVMVFPAPTSPQTGEEKVRYVLNRKETLLAREKQAQIKMEFESWLVIFTGSKLLIHEILVILHRYPCGAKHKTDVLRL